MGILRSIIRFFRNKWEDEKGSGEPGSIRASFCKFPKINLFQKISSFLFFRKIPRNSDPVLPVKNPLVLSRNHTFVQKISSTYESPADLNPETESHVRSSAVRVPPADLELRRDLELDLVDSAVATENENNEESPEDQNVKNCSVIIGNIKNEECPDDQDVKNCSVIAESIEKKEECPDDQKVKVCLVSEGGKWIKHYNSNHRILLVGEGDFSFSACLAVAFGSAPYMIATSLDSTEFLKKNYKNAMSNIQKLTSRKSRVMHEIDATTVASHPFLGKIAFDRIIFNFPHAGFFPNLSRKAVLRKHRRLVSLFLMNAKQIVNENGEIHISHKTNGFHKEWNLESMASFCGLKLIEAVEFNLLDYPGYNTKYGFGGDRNFDCYPSNTYKFGLERQN